jgi:hypothetical protein
VLPCYSVVSGAKVFRLHPPDGRNAFFLLQKYKKPNSVNCKQTAQSNSCRKQQAFESGFPVSGLLRRIG